MNKVVYDNSNNTQRTPELDDSFSALPLELRRIAEVVGLEPAIRISEAFKGTRIYIPALDELKRAERDERLRALYLKRRTVRDLSEMFGLSERAIWKILARPALSLSKDLKDILNNLHQRP